MQASGVIAVVQEHRFELLRDDGTRRHFTLAHQAPLGWAELVQWQREGCRVTVEHDASKPGHSTAAAYSVRRLRAIERTTG
jgi:hypothetical protein